MHILSISDKEITLQRSQADSDIYELSDVSGQIVYSFRLKNNNIVPTNGQELSADVVEPLISMVEDLHRSETLGIEEDKSRDDAETLEPFDPKDISLTSNPVTMDTLIRRINQSTLLLNPDFQRREVWDIERKSRLIESLLLKIPIPMFYVASDANDNWTVVDGLQRLSTIRDFIIGQDYLKTKDPQKSGHGFKLQNLEFWTEYNGYDMAMLPPKLYNRIMETVFSFTVINPPTPEDVKLNIFKRINTGGMQLSPQEIRNALYMGPCTLLLNRLANSASFKKATDYSIHADRMQDKELVLRFVAFMVRDYKSYQKTLTSDIWLSQAMILINNHGSYASDRFRTYAMRNKISLDGLTNLSPDEIAARFDMAMERAARLFGKHAFRKSFGNKRRTPINKSLFEVWGIILQSLSADEFDTLLKNKTELFKKYHKYLEDSQFIIAISRDSMKWQSVTKRYSTLINLTSSILARSNQ